MHLFIVMSWEGAKKLIDFFFLMLWCTKKLNVWSHPTTITKLQKAPKKDWNPWTHPKVLIANTSKNQQSESDQKLSWEENYNTQCNRDLHHELFSNEY